MYAIINEKFSLRSYWYVPYAYCVKNNLFAHPLQEEEFELLRKCDGHTDLPHTPLLESLIDKKLIRECEYGTKLNKWQEYKNCDNRYMPKMNLQITGRCNYNCRHCFNAADNSPLQSELSLPQLEHLFDECVKCGINAFTITGGEPMLHPHYKEIIQAIYARDMYVFELNTNGFYITKEMLQWMKKINYKPLIKISFDGIGFHNWMRGYEKAEEKTLSAIKLCIEEGFEVKVQMNVNKKNLSSIVPSLIMLDKMGVKETRIIKTTDAPRWLENGKGNSLSIREYYDACIDIVKEYLSEKRNMNLTGWILFYICPIGKYYNFIPVECSKGEYRDSLPLCRGARGMIAVGANGNVYPCMQSEGYFEKEKIYLGNVIKDSLQSLLQESDYMDMVATTVADRLNSSSNCKNCEHFERCVGGCPAMAILTSGHYLLEDKSKCIFFNEGYEEKLEKAFPKEFRRMR